MRRGLKQPSFELVDDGVGQRLRDAGGEDHGRLVMVPRTDTAWKDGDGAVRGTAVPGAAGSVPLQGALLRAGEGPSRSVLEAVMGLAQCREVIQAGGPALAPGLDMVDVAACCGNLTTRVGAGEIPGSYGVGERGRRTVTGASDVQDDAGDRVSE